MLRDVPEHGEPKVSRLQRSPPRAQAPRRINRPSRIARLQLRTHDARTHTHAPSSVRRPSPRPMRASTHTHTHTVRAGHTTSIHTTARLIASHAPHATTPRRERAPRTHRSRSRSPPRARARTAPPPRPTYPCRPLWWCNFSSHFRPPRMCPNRPITNRRATRMCQSAKGGVGRQCASVVGRWWCDDGGAS